MTLTFEFSSEAHTVSRGKIYETEEKNIFTSHSPMLLTPLLRNSHPRKKENLQKPTLLPLVTSLSCEFIGTK